jgi:hypothetical protein
MLNDVKYTGERFNVFATEVRIVAQTVTVTDEQYERLQAAARRSNRSVEQVLDEVLQWLPEPQRTVSAEEYEQQWASFWPLVGSIQHGQPLTNEEIDDLIGEEAAETHADASA